MEAIDWIFFDIGGVLADESSYRHFREETITELLRSYVGDISHEVFERAFAKASVQQGSVSELTVRQILHDYQYQGDTEEIITKLREVLHTSPSYLSHEVIRENAAEVVAALAGKYKIGIIANQPEAIKEKLADAGVFGFLTDCTVAPDSTGKPSLAYFHEVFEKTGADPARSVMIDDNRERGLWPAKQLGMTTVWFTDNSVPDESVDYTVKDLQELLPLFI
jgi:HAD superfamily hydrolase (TIGR01509 family)